MSAATGRFSVLHVSDVHATEAGLLYGAVDGLGRLAQLAEYAAAVGMTPEAVVVTGDLAQRGNPGAYPELARAFAALERAVGAPVVTVLGNHDDPAAAAALPRHRVRHSGVERIGEYRFVRLDSSSGSLGAEQLAWLREALEEPHGAGTVIALHHPPVDSPLPALRKQGLRDADALMAALAGTDARAILAGHFHHSLSASRDGIPIFVGPSLAYHQVMDAGPDAVAGHDSPMFSLVQFTSVGVTASAIPLHSPQPLFTRLIAEQVDSPHHAVPLSEKATHVS